MPRLNQQTDTKEKKNRSLKMLSLAIGLALVSMVFLEGCATVPKDPSWGAVYTKNYIEKGQYKQAIEQGKRVTQQNPSYAPGWYWLGMAYINSSQWDEAISALKKALGRNPSKDQRASSYYHLGFAYENKTEYEEAIQWYTRRLEIETNVTTLMQRSHCYTYKGMYDEALADTKRLIKELNAETDKGKLAEVYRTRAFSYLGLGETERALSTLQKATEIFPDFNPSDDLKLIYYATGNEQKLTELMGNKGWLGTYLQEYTQGSVKGIQVFNVVKRSPAEKAGLMKGDLILKMDGRTFSGVKEFINRIGSTAPGSTVPFEILRGKEKKTVQVKLGSNRDEAALAHLESSAIIKPYLEKKRIYRAAEEAEENGEYRKAFNLYMNSSAKRPLDSDMIKRIIRLYQKLDPPPVIPEEAHRRAIFAQTAAKEAKDERGYERAIAEYKRAVQVAPWWPDLYLNLALIHEQLGNYLQAAESLKVFLLAAPNDPQAAVIQDKIYEMEYKAKSAGRK